MRIPFVDKLLNNDFLRSVSVLSSGNILANIISFVSIPILSRIYTEEAFGDYALMGSIAAIIVCLTTFGLRSAIMSPRDDIEAKMLLTFTFEAQVLCITVIFVLSALFPFIYDVQQFLKYNNYFISISLIYLYSIFSGMNNLLIVYTNKLKKNRVLFWNTLINALVLVVITIPLGIVGLSGEGFMIGAIISCLIADLQMIVKTHPFASVTFLKHGRLFVVKYRDFIRYQFPSNVIGVYALQVPKQQFSYLFGNSSLGGYVMCEKILGIPSRLLGGPIGNIYFRQATTYVYEGKNLSAFTYKLIYRILLVSFVPLTILVFISEPLFSFILGDNWTKVGKIVNIMILPYVLSFCSSCLDYCLVVLNKQKINLYLTILSLLLTIVFIFLGYHFYGGFIGGIIGYSVSLVIYNVVNLVSIFYFLKSHLLRIAIVLFIYIVSILMVFFLKNIGVLNN